MEDQTPHRKPLTYAAAGVDIDRADSAKQRIRDLARSTFGAGVLSDIGSFGGLFRPDFLNYAKPVLVSSADGVGTKLKIAFLTGVHNSVGRDLVAHCVNDILVQGAVPLFFLDYIATGRLDPDVVEQVISGLADGCRQAGCALLGGETAEMPDFYADGEYDLAGFIVGMADETRLLGAHRVSPGDKLIGIPSSGLHTNGYSLVRRLFLDELKMRVDQQVPEFGRTLGEELLVPHRNYLPLLRELLFTDDLSALAHITGGGIPGNLNRVLPENVDAVVNHGTWEVPAIFRVIRDRGAIEPEEMYRTFNMGIGMILVVPEHRFDRVGNYLQRQGSTYYVIGETKAGTGKVRLE